MLTYKLKEILATKITKERRGWGKAPYLFNFFVFFVAMKTYPHVHSIAKLWRRGQRPRTVNRPLMALRSVRISIASTCPNCA